MASQAAIEAEQMRRRQQKSMLRKPPYTATCPRCGARVGASCRRPDGEERPAHSERFDQFPAVTRDCWTTGHRCTNGAGHGGPHRSGEGIEWGGERCLPDQGVHVFPLLQVPDCQCGKHTGLEPRPQHGFLYEPWVQLTIEQAAAA